MCCLNKKIHKLFIELLIAKVSDCIVKSNHTEINLPYIDKLSMIVFLESIII